MTMKNFASNDVFLFLITSITQVLQPFPAVGMIVFVAVKEELISIAFVRCSMSWRESRCRYFTVVGIDESILSWKLLFSTLVQNCQTDFIVGCTHRLVNIIKKISLSLLFGSQIVAVKSLSQLSETVHLGVVMAVECFSALFFVGHYMGLDFSIDTCSALLLFHVPSKQCLD